uniref:Uncharacterized protein n=1 Tax=Monodon monoceros TaxID=40151 RepID=A0A8C6BFJ5_MONMO
MCLFLVSDLGGVSEPPPAPPYPIVCVGLLGSLRTPPSLTQPSPPLLSEECQGVEDQTLLDPEEESSPLGCALRARTGLSKLLSLDEQSWNAKGPENPDFSLGPRPWVMQARPREQPGVS